MLSRNIEDGLFGLCVGEAVGLPVDCRSRKYLQQHPVLDLEGFGTYNLPPGTWSDGSSLTFCTAEALAEGFNLESIAEKFILWAETAYWTPNGEVVGKWNPTVEIIGKLKQRVSGSIFQSPATEVPTNFTLLWMLPFAYLTFGLAVEKRIKIIQDTVSFIEKHPLNEIGAIFYNELAIRLLEGKEKQDAVVQTQEFMLNNFPDISENDDFTGLLSGRIISLTIEDIRASNTLIDTLTVAVWTLLQHDNFRDAVLSAVNLGEDTDAIGAIAGGLCGIAFGYKSIPDAWVRKIARIDDIEQLIDRFSKKMKRWESQMKSSQIKSKKR